MIGSLVLELVLMEKRNDGFSTLKNKHYNVYPKINFYDFEQVVEILKPLFCYKTLVHFTFGPWQNLSFRVKPAFIRERSGMYIQSRMICLL